MKLRMSDRLRSTLPLLVAGASAGVAAVWLLRLRSGGPPPNAALDLAGLRERLSAIDGCEGVHVRAIGGGIIEACGVAADPETVDQVLAVLRVAPGVTTVVNRVWTPALGSRRPDIFPPGRTHVDSPRPQASGEVGEGSPRPA